MFNVTLIICGVGFARLVTWQEHSLSWSPNSRVIVMVPIPAVPSEEWKKLRGSICQDDQVVSFWVPEVCCPEMVKPVSTHCQVTFGGGSPWDTQLRVSSLPGCSKSGGVYPDMTGGDGATKVFAKKGIVHASRFCDFYWSFNKITRIRNCGLSSNPDSWIVPNGRNSNLNLPHITFQRLIAMCPRIELAPRTDCSAFYLAGS